MSELLRGALSGRSTRNRPAVPVLGIHPLQPPCSGGSPMLSARSGADRRRRFAVVAGSLLAATLVMTTAACGGDTDTASNEKVKLTVATFGEFGFKALYTEYMAAHPNIEIVERITKTEDHQKNLAAHLATNSGAADIEA